MCVYEQEYVSINVCLCIGLCKSICKKINPNECQRVCEPERKCEYERKYGYEFVSRSESSIVNISVSISLIGSFSLKMNTYEYHYENELQGDSE